MSGALHFESQRGMLCGMHAVNALLQYEYGDHYRKSDMDSICLMLDPPRCCHVNAHRHWMNQGDYDVNVLLYALSSRGLDSAWFDARNPASGMDLTGAVGLLMNGPGTGAYGGIGLDSGNHWYALRLANGTWWDLNSMNRAPRRFLDVGEMLNDVQAVLAAGGQCILIRPVVQADKAAPAAATGAGKAGTSGASPASTASSTKPGTASAGKSTGSTSLASPAKGQRERESSEGSNSLTARVSKKEAGVAASSTAVPAATSRASSSGGTAGDDTTAGKGAANSTQGGNGLTDKARSRSSVSRDSASAGSRSREESRGKTSRQEARLPGPPSSPPAYPSYPTYPGPPAPLLATLAGAYTPAPPSLPPPPLATTLHGGRQSGVTTVVSPLSGVHIPSPPPLAYGQGAAPSAGGGYRPAPGGIQRVTSPLSAAPLPPPPPAVPLPAAYYAGSSASSPMRSLPFPPPPPAGSLPGAGAGGVYRQKR